LFFLSFGIRSNSFRIISKKKILTLFVATIDIDWLDECLFVRQIDGRCNHIVNHELGSINRYLKRGAEGAFYLDGIRQPHVTPNPRTVSNNLFRADDTILDPHGHNAAWVFFGQFIAHDLMGVHRVGDLNASGSYLVQS